MKRKKTYIFSNFSTIQYIYDSGFLSNSSDRIELVFYQRKSYERD